MEKEKKQQINTPTAIIVAGFLIMLAILIKGGKTPAEPIIVPNDNGAPVATTLAPVGTTDRTLGNPKAKVTLIMYEDFQCPFCGAISGLMQSDAPLIKSLQQKDPNWTPFMGEIINNYVKNGKVLLVYRDWAFLGPESIKASEAARCAGDQDKFWEYHDYLYSHQNGENQGNFSDPNLKSFAKGLGLNTTSFDTCLDSNKYTQAIADSKNEGLKAGVAGTPKGFILRDGKIVSTIDGAESLSTVKPKIDGALK
ncbi:MAG: thioredoxin domain-containing protein [Candidatus Paceibacterota bacterium]|jgi:protein-disulfide isomerase